MNLEQIASALFPSIFGRPVLVPVVPFAGSAGSMLTAGRDTTTLVQEIDSLIGELLLGKRKKLNTRQLLINLRLFIIVINMRVYLQYFQPR